MKRIDKKKWNRMSNREQREWLRLKKIGGLKGRVLRSLSKATDIASSFQDITCLTMVSDFVESYPEGADYKNQNHDVRALDFFEEYLNEPFLYESEDSDQLIAYMKKAIKEYKEQKVGV